MLPTAVAQADASAKLKFPAVFLPQNTDVKTSFERL